MLAFPLLNQIPETQLSAAVDEDSTEIEDSVGTGLSVFALLLSTQTASLAETAIVEEPPKTINEALQALAKSQGKPAPLATSAGTTLSEKQPATLANRQQAANSVTNPNVTSPNASGLNASGLNRAIRPVNFPDDVRTPGSSILDTTTPQAVAPVLTLATSAVDNGDSQSHSTDQLLTPSDLPVANQRSANPGESAVKLAADDRPTDSTIKIDGFDSSANEHTPKVIEPGELAFESERSGQIHVSDSVKNAVPAVTQETAFGKPNSLAAAAINAINAAEPNAPTGRIPSSEVSAAQSADSSVVVEATQVSSSSPTQPSTAAAAHAANNGADSEFEDTPDSEPESLDVEAETRISTEVPVLSKSAGVVPAEAQFRAVAASASSFRRSNRQIRTPEETTATTSVSSAIFNDAPVGSLPVLPLNNESPAASEAAFGNTPAAASTATSPQAIQKIVDAIVAESAAVFNNKTMTVEFEEPHIGSVLLEVSETDTGMSVSVAAGDELTLEMLNANSQQFEQSLKDHHIELLEIVSLQMHTSTGDHGQSQQASHQEMGDSYRSAQETNSEHSDPVQAAAAAAEKLDFRA